MNYPPDWPCKCGHLKKEHGKAAYNLDNVCLVKGEEVNFAGEKYADQCAHFSPMDNLTYVERVANARTASL
jgi:hypothetical protein